MEPVELTLTRHRTAELLREAQTYRLATEARAATRAHGARPPYLSHLHAVAARVGAATGGAVTALGHRFGPAARTTVGTDVCCA